MSSIFTNLLFLHGHIADPALARRLADLSEQTTRQKGKRERTPDAKPAVTVVLPSRVVHEGCG